MDGGECGDDDDVFWSFFLTVSDLFLLVTAVVDLQYTEPAEQKPDH